MKLSKLVGLALGGGCGVLAVVAAALMLGVGGRVETGADGIVVPERPLPDLTIASAFALDDQDDYALIANRPLFNEDRLPDPDGPSAGGPEDEDEGELVDEPPPPLNVDVKGIIIGPGVKVAIVTDQKSKETVRIREGMPLEGELAAWTLDEIQPRMLVFAGQDDQRAEVELQVFSGALAGGPPVRTRQAAPAAATNEGSENNPQDEQQAEAETDPEARAEEIRRRVAERRAQLREEAERRRAERENDDN